MIKIGKKRVKFDTTEHGLTHRIYHGQRSRCRRAGRPLPVYSKEELRTFIYAQPNFKKLFKEWVDSGYKTELKPSIDRLDDYKGYTLSNIQLVTWEENNHKAHKDRKEGRNNKYNKAVEQYDLEGNYMNTYHSQMEAQRITGIPVSNISNAAKGNRKTAGKSVWRYAS